MKILDPLSWATANVAVLVGAVVFGVVYWLLTAFHLNVVLGLNIAIAYACARWAEVAWHALKGETTLMFGARRR